MTQAQSCSTRQPDILLGLIGEGISASRTPALHMAEARAQGMVCSYRLLDTTTPPFAEKSLGEILATCERKGFAGVNVTHPFKQQAIGHLDELSFIARKIGAVNTVLFRQGQRIGYNTDFSGYRAAFRSQMTDQPCGRVLLLGAGGAAAAVARAFLDLGTRVLTIFDRDPTRAEALATSLSADHPTVSVVPISEPEARIVSVQDGVVNATPMGMAAYPGTAIDPALLAPRQWVSDIVYFPLETELILKARSAGCPVMSGAGMAIHQAAEAFRHFTGLAADPARMASTFSSFATTPPQTRSRTNA